MAIIINAVQQARQIGKSDRYNEYFAHLHGEQALAAIKELNEIIDREELFCEDSFHVLRDGTRL